LLALRVRSFLENESLMNRMILLVCLYVATFKTRSHRLILALSAVAIFIYLSFQFPTYDYVFKYVYAALILIGGADISKELSELAKKELRSHHEKNALLRSNGIEVSRYIISAVAAASYLSFSPTAFLATATFSELVLGLALQPTIGSFFAGLLLLFSGIIRPGSQVRIMSWYIPFQGAFFPGYKYFSPDQIYARYMEGVIEVGFFFTTILTEKGQTMKIPNTIIATNAAVITYTNKDYVFNVRYEFPQVRP